MLILRRIMAGVLLAIAAVAVAPGAAQAATAGCTSVEAGEDENGDIVYEWFCPGDESEGPGTPGGGGGGPALCDLSSVEGVADTAFCVGTTACAVNNPSHLEESTWPADRPTPEHIYTWRWCTTAAGETSYDWYWYLPEVQGPTLEELATQAYGALAAPSFSVEFNPPGRAIVGVPTWFWAGTGVQADLRGTSAGPVVAIAEVPGRLELEPGDGRTPGTLTCPWVTAMSDACSVEYTRSSAWLGGEAPAYTARMRMVFDVRFENAGAPLDLPGLPTALTSDWVEVAVPVAEIQTLVTTGR